MELIFCNDALAPSQPDSSYQNEADAAVMANFSCALVDFELLTRGDDSAAVLRRVPTHDTPQLALYRGWMLRPEKYAQLYRVLQERNIHLVNTPQQYQHCHWLPASYEIIAPFTPRTIWLPLAEGLAMENVWSALEIFSEKSLIVKDYVKSRKHEWHEACFIPDASDRENVEKVVRRFLELQGEQLAGGLVFREWVPLRTIGAHAKSGMPLAREFRLFFLDGELLHFSEYWIDGDYSGEAPPLAKFSAVASRIQSRFFTMDIAQCEDGSWIIVELGDAQVAGLPRDSDAGEFYRALQARAPKL